MPLNLSKCNEKRQKNIFVKKIFFIFLVNEPGHRQKHTHTHTQSFTLCTPQ